MFRSTLSQWQRSSSAAAYREKGDAEEATAAEAFTNLYLDHVDTDGRLLFEQIVKMDLGG